MKYLGVDWGLRRVGLAVSEGELADPLTSLEIYSLQDGVRKVADVASREGVQTVVVGKPEGEIGKAVEKAVSRMIVAGLHVITADETLSTHAAKRKLIKMGKGKKARRDDNAMAAAIILQRYLDEKP